MLENINESVHLKAEALKKQKANPMKLSGNKKPVYTPLLVIQNNHL